MKQPDDWDPDELETIADLRDQLEVLRARHAGDPPLAVLRAARGDALPEPLQAGVSRQLSASAWHQALVDGADAVELQVTPEDEQRLLNRIHRDTAQTQSSSAWRRLWMPALATVAAAALVVVVVRRGDLAVRSIEPPSSSAPTLTTPSAPPRRHSWCRSRSRTSRFSPAALPYRGAASGQGLLADLKPALDAFRESDYPRADREFAALATRYPKSVEVAFYQGVARIYLNDLEGAEQSLAVAEQLNDTDLYLRRDVVPSLVDERAGRTASARTRLDALCRDGSFVRQVQACQVASKVR